jgi:hypothetical protein
MNLCGEFVTHKVFGRGQISEQENDCLTVLFSETHEKKRFIYPSALGTFLIPENKVIVKQMKENDEEIAQMKAAARKEVEDRVAGEKQAAKDLAKKLKKAAKKPVVKAEKAIKVKKPGKIIFEEISEEITEEFSEEPIEE